MALQQPAPTADDEQSADAGLRDQFLLNLLGKRKEAIQGRAGSGIEIEWQEDEEFYQGIDDANRQYQNTGQISQPKRWATTGRSGTDKGPTRSVVFLNITRPYVDAASARVADMLLPTDDRSWTIQPTPMPNLTGADVQWLGGPDAARSALQAAIDDATNRANGMQQTIDDRLTESNWHGEVRRVIEDASRIGSGVLKGPFPVKRSARMSRVDQATGTQEFIKVEELQPASKRVDPWNFFPDPSCGDDIHNGTYTWEREYLSKRQVRDLIGRPDYDSLAVVKVLKEGPGLNSAREAPAGTTSPSDDQFEMWIFHGYVAPEHLRAFGVEDIDDDADKLPAMAVVINDSLVKVVLSVLDSGDFPYDVLAWQQRPGLPWGMGIARQVRTAQRMLNGACRSMMDNSALSAAPQIVFGNGVTPQDGTYTLRGGKLWRAEEGIDVTKAFASFTVESVQTELMNIIEFALRMAEDTTGMPAMLQGIRGDTPDTLGGMQLQNNNASSVLRRLAKRFDDYMTRPHILRYFDWMMQYSDDDSIKGDMEVDVRASSALVERDAQQQFLMQSLAVAKDPAYGIDPAKLFAELAKGQRLDPRKIQYTPEQKAQMAQQPPDPKNLADADKSSAQAQLALAQVKKTEAETAKVRGEQQYSAMQSAQVIASVPETAPLADQLLASQGFEDQNGGEAVPELAATVAHDEGAPPVEVPANTDPMTPTSPDRGVQQGIETPAADGVRQ